VIAASIMALSGGDVGSSLFLAAALLAGLPVIDTALVLISRRRSGIPLVMGGTDHMTHRLLMRLGSARNVALVLGGIQSLLGAIAVAAVQMGKDSVVAAWTIWLVAAARLDRCARVHRLVSRAIVREAHASI
jgi:UDP-GlcNAc:undecaprenyl-phosphate/decaprenyl-phosphate GlcNAc-1-phosphate transferase